LTLAKRLNIYLYIFLWLEMRPTLSFGCSFASAAPPFYDDWYCARLVSVCGLRHMVKFYMLGLYFFMSTNRTRYPRVLNTHRTPTTCARPQWYILDYWRSNHMIYWTLYLVYVSFLWLYIFNILVFNVVSYDEPVPCNYSVVYPVLFLWWNTLGLPPSYPICVQCKGTTW